MSKPARALTRVCERTIVPTKEPDRFHGGLVITGFYVSEHMECGHKLTVYPAADPLIARHRVCRFCKMLAELPPKKLPQPVARVPAWRRVA